MEEANLLLEALLTRAGISHAGLAKQLNVRGAHLRLRYDHASVARWIRDHAIPRHPVPEMICHVIGERLGIDVTHLRGQAHRYAGLALILGAQGDLDRCVYIAGHMLGRAEGMESGRIYDRIAHVTRVLRPHATEPNVAAFLERANEYLPLKGI